MAFAIVALSLGAFGLAIQWYAGKKADDEEMGAQVHRHHRKAHISKR